MKTAIKTIDYYYSIRSSFTYLGAAQINELTKQYGRRLIHKPLLLSVTMPPIGAQQFADRPPLRTAYMRHDLARWAKRRDIAVELEPIHHNGPMELPSGIVIAAQRAKVAGEQPNGDVDGLSLAILGALWRDDRDIADETVIAELCTACGFDPDPLIPAATGASVQLEVERNCREAIIRGVLGAPTYFVDGENFYGQDRLDFVEQALKRSA